MAYGKAHLEAQLKRALAEEIQALEDPRLFKDGSVLSVYVEAFREEEGALRALSRAERRLVAALARRVRMRRLPRLEFLPWRASPA